MNKTSSKSTSLQNSRTSVSLLFQTTLPTFQSPDFSVTRQHEDFVWLHDTLIETEEYAGLIVSVDILLRIAFYNGKT